MEEHKWKSLSDFVHNATEEEKKELLTKVAHQVNLDQQETMLVAAIITAERNRILGVIKELSSICDSAPPDGGNEAYSDGIIEGWFDLRDKILAALSK